MLGPSAASGQLLSIGALGGVALTDQTSVQPNESKRYLVGLSVEFALPANFAVEADAIYQRLGVSNFFPASIPASVGTSQSLSFDLRQRGNAWEFPLLGKYYFRPRGAAWRPFVGTGFAFRTVGTHFTGSEVTIDSTGATHIFSLNNNTRSLNAGATVAAGVRIHAGPLAVLPQFRYTYWGGMDNLTRHSEAAFLVGLTF